MRDGQVRTGALPDAVAYLGLGANKESPFQSCLEAIRHLSESAGIEVVQCASFYRTEPVSNIMQPWFINTVLEIRTGLSSCSLLAVLQKIETKMGRVRTVKNGPRIIDMDILLFNRDILMESDFLRIPHPELHKRRFVLIPMNDIAPQFIHPVMDLSMKTLLDVCPDRGIITWFSHPVLLQ